ncbi:Helix-turn-helix domain protein [compost metagenome]
MKYSELLSEYIEKSGLTLGEISTKIQEEKGISIDRSYISMLKNNKTKNPASDEINRALAEVTGGDPGELVMAAYYEKAPEEVKNKIERADSFTKTLKQLMKLDNEDLTDNEINARYAEIMRSPAEDIQAEFEKLGKNIVKKSDESLLNSYKIVRSFETGEDISQITEYLTKLKKMRKIKNVSPKEMAAALNLTEDLYTVIESLGGIKVDGDSEVKLNTYYELALNYLASRSPNVIDEELAQFEEFVNNPEHGLFFKDYLSAPEERRAEMRQIFNILQSKEKDRKPGDKQDK